MVISTHIIEEKTLPHDFFAVFSEIA